MEIKIEHRVVFDASEGLLKVLKKIVEGAFELPNTVGLVMKTDEEIASFAETLVPTEPEKPAKAEEPAETKKPEAKAEEPSETEKPEAKAEKGRKWTTVDVRAAMQAVRNRLEYGPCEDGEEKGPNEDFDPAIHRQLNAAFKAEAKSLGYDKPSELTSEVIPAFIEHINNLHLDGSNNVVPF